MASEGQPRNPGEINTRLAEVQLDEAYADNDAQIAARVAHATIREAKEFEQEHAALLTEAYAQLYEMNQAEELVGEELVAVYESLISGYGSRHDRRKLEKAFTFRNKLAPGELVSEDGSTCFTVAEGTDETPIVVPFLRNPSPQYGPGHRELAFSVLVDHGKDHIGYHNVSSTETLVGKDEIEAFLDESWSRRYGFTSTFFRERIPFVEGYQAIGSNKADGFIQASIKTATGELSRGGKSDEASREEMIKFLIVHDPDALQEIYDEKARSVERHSFAWKADEIIAFVLAYLEAQGVDYSNLTASERNEQLIEAVQTLSRRGAELKATEEQEPLQVDSDLL